MIKLQPWGREEDIKVLMEDRCTKEEAIRHLNKGSLVIPVEDWEVFLEQYDDQYDDVEAFHKEWSVENIKAGKLEDHSFVECDGKEYIIEYVL